jgi:hypothetical protein
MLSDIKVINRQGAVLSLPLDDSIQGFVIQEIAGLEPVNATLVSSSFANMDGTQYHSSRREARNVKLKLGLETENDFASVRDLRMGLYDFFMPKSEVTLRFHLVEGEGILDYLDWEVTGRIESFEAPIFAQEPVVDISIMCFDPDYRDIVPVSVKDYSTSGTGEIMHAYPGTVETGIEFVLRVDRSISGFTFFHRPPDGTVRTMVFTYPLAAGDVLRINTATGEKNVTLVRGGVETSLLYALSPQSNWVELQPGVNKFRVLIPGTQMPIEVNYTTRYGGL